MSLKPPILTVGKFEFYAVSEHGMTFTNETPRAEWLDAVKRLTHFYEHAGMARERTLMLIADALTFGEQTYGEDYAQAIEDARSALGLKIKTVQNAIYTYKRIPVALRGASLTLSHYKEISPLEAEEQEKFIARAVKENLTVAELKNEIAVAHPTTKRGKPRAAKTLVVDLESEEGLHHAAEKVAEFLTKQAKSKEKLSKKWKGALEPAYKAYRRCFISKG